MQHDRSRGREGQFRIIAGRWRGRRLAFPPLAGIRPSPDRVRETLYNWLAPVIEGSICLDLFAGSGALGLEALSRGAAHVSFVDRQEPAIRRIRDHLALLACENADTSTADAFEYLDNISAAQDREYDIVLLDPPFDSDYADRVITALEGCGVLARRATIYLELPAAKDLPDMPASWKLLHSKTAGQVGYHLWLRSQGS
jgi:16S rRNA (guanine966-N2)-methyltransferase